MTPGAQRFVEPAHRHGEERAGRLGRAPGDRGSGRPSASRARRLRGPRRGSARGRSSLGKRRSSDKAALMSSRRNKHRTELGGWQGVFEREGSSDRLRLGAPGVATAGEGVRRAAGRAGVWGRTRTEPARAKFRTRMARAEIGSRAGVKNLQSVGTARSYENHGSNRREWLWFAYETRGGH